jgi:uncharacterized MAPEG superfamily protein
MKRPGLTLAAAKTTFIPTNMKPVWDMLVATAVARHVSQKASHILVWPAAHTFLMFSISVISLQTSVLRAIRWSVSLVGCLTL